MADVGMGTLYDMNKNIIKQQGKLSKKAFKDGIALIKQYFIDKDNTYYMLLCNENKDYTVFRIIDSFEEAEAAIRDCLVNRGDTYSITHDKNGGVEIWLEIENEMYCYYLFPYDTAIIEV